MKSQHLPPFCIYEFFMGLSGTNPFKPSALGSSNTMILAYSNGLIRFESYKVYVLIFRGKSPDILLLIITLNLVYVDLWRKNKNMSRLEANKCPYNKSRLQWAIYKSSVMVFFFFVWGFLPFISNKVWIKTYHPIE